MLRVMMASGESNSGDPLHPQQGCYAAVALLNLNRLVVVRLPRFS
jgi:hypothetical protein